MRRAVISVSEKDGVVELGRALAEAGWEILSTGGTSRVLKEAGVSVLDIADVSGSPEILGGRVKTLHPAVHGGILARRDNPGDMQDLKKEGIGAIDLVVVNLYPFSETVAKLGVTEAEATEEVDIGGHTLIRASAKNFLHVAIVTSPDQYGQIIEAVKSEEGITLELRRELAKSAWEHARAYDEAIAGYFGASSEAETYALKGEVVQSLRYGENPHQSAAWYRTPGEPGIQDATVLHGKELSFNNLYDLEGAIGIVRDFPKSENVVSIIKHANPAGVGRGKDIAQAYERALSCDPVSAFGGIVASNQTIDAAMAQKMSELFLECVCAPSYEKKALAILTKKKNIRLLEWPGMLDQPVGKDVRRLVGGFLLQDRDGDPLSGIELKVATKRQPTEEEMEALKFAWVVAKHAKSNAIILANAVQTLGVGAGQMSRVDSTRLAKEKNVVESKLRVLASDAFFPFRDGLDQAYEAGATAVIQPGGSIRDEEVIAAADEHGMAMIFTGQRHFRH